MSDEKKKISVLVPVSLLDKLKETSDLNITEATIKGLELVANNTKSDVNIIEEYHREINILKVENERLQEKIKIIDENQVKMEELQEKRVNDLKESVISLNEQIKIKDKIIEDLNKNLFAQANSLYNLTNTKLLPENTESKKPWWRFW